MAIVNVPKHHLPSLVEVNGQGSALAYQALTLNASGDKLAFIVQCPKDGTLDSFEFMTSSVSNNPDNGIRCSFQTVDGATGLPDDTDDQYRDIIGALSANAWQTPGLITSDGTDGGSKRTVSSGEMIACVIKFVSWVTPDSFNLNVLAGATNGIAGSCYVGNGTTGSWAKPNNYAPNLLLKYNDSTYAVFPLPVGPWSAITASPFNNTNTPDEIGLRFQVPVQCEAVGIWVRADFNADVDVVLYDDSDVAQRTVVMDSTIQFGALNLVREFYFDPITIPASTTYRMTMKPSSASNITFETLTLPSNAYLAALPGGSTWYRTERTDAGAWTDTDTQYTLMGLIVDGYETSAGGGGGGGSYTFVG